MEKQHVLITNDDGIDALGLQILEKTIRDMGRYRVTVVAPSEQQSASSHSLTLTIPIRVIERDPGRYAVTGTPTDTVLVAVQEILKDDPPDVILSGINHGPNMGEDVIYSGTVAAAMEGAMLGITSIALSLAAWHPTDFTGGARFVRDWLPKILANPGNNGVLLNINIPDGEPRDIKGVKVVRLGSRVYHDVITTHTDPRGRPYLWIGGHGPTWTDDADTDFQAVQAGYVSVTPLIIDLTHYELLAKLGSLEADSTPPAREGEQA